MTKFKKIIAIVLALMLCFTVIGCGDEKPADDTSASTDASVSDTQGTESTGSDASASTDSASSEDDKGDVLKPNNDSKPESNNSSSGSSSNKTNNNSSTTKPDNNTYVEHTGTKQEKLFGNLKGTKIRVPSNPTLTDWEKTFIAQFEKKYGVDVITVPMSFDEQQTKLPSLIASKDKKNYLDVCTVSNVVFLRYLYGNMIKDFTKYVDPEDDNWKYFGTNIPAYNTYTLNNKIYGSVSIEIHETFVYYNKTYFKEKGIKDPYTDYYLKNNWTFDTFRQVAKQAVSYAADKKTVQTYGWATWNYFAFAQAAGNTVIETDGKKWNINLTDPNGMAALNLLYECAKDGSIAPFTGYNEFTKRKTAMLIERPAYAIQGTDAYNRMSDEIGMVPMPRVNKSSSYYYPVSADGYGIPSCAQNVPGAVAYIYELNKAIEQRNSVEPGLTTYRKRISVEHEKIRNDYIKKAKPCNTWVDGLSGWYNGKGNREKFLDIILEEKANPAVALDRMLPLLKESLRATVG